LKLEAGNWLIADIDFEDEQGVISEINRFKQRYSSAEEVH